VKYMFGGVPFDKSLEDDAIKVVDGYIWLSENLQPREIFQFVPYSREFRSILDTQIDKAHTVLEKMIALHKNNIDPNNARDILDELLIHQIDEKWDFIDIKALIANIGENGATFNLGQTSAWFIAYVAKYPEIQKKIHEELDRVVGKTRLPNINDRNELKYFEATVNEVLRSRPIICETLFHKVNEDFECDGYFFKRNTSIILSIYNIHHNPKYWKDPDSFNPERFLNWDETSPHFIPFSTGPRACAGFRVAKAALFYFLTFLFSRYEIVAPEKFEIPAWNFNGFLPPQDFKVFLKSR